MKLIPIEKIFPDVMRNDIYLPPRDEIVSKIEKDIVLGVVGCMADPRIMLMKNVMHESRPDEGCN